MSQPTNPETNPHLNAAATTAPEAAPPADQSAPPAASGAAPFLSQARQWLQDHRLPATLPPMPAPLQRLATQTGGRWRRLSTTQKVVGGALLAVGGWYLLRPSAATRRRYQMNPISTLQELLLFVNDRIEGYRRAASESPDADLRNYYEQLAGQSQEFAHRLNGYLRVQDSPEQTSTTLKGKLYRAWMEAKAAVTGYSDMAVLDSNIYGEEWALKAYEEALQDRTVSGSLRREVERQYAQSRQTHHKLQQLQAQY